MRNTVRSAVSPRFDIICWKMLTECAVTDGKALFLVEIVTEMSLRDWMATVRLPNRVNSGARIEGRHLYNATERRRIVCSLI
jgi:hypothetical protein